MVKECIIYGNKILKKIFHKQSISQDGLQSQCKSCWKKYYIENQQKIEKSYLQKRDRSIDNQNLYDKQNRAKIRIY